MAEAASKTPAKTEAAATPSVSGGWHPFESLRREVDRLFEDFDRGWQLPFRRGGVDLEPFWRRELTLASVPAIDIVEKDQAYEVTAELPGMDEKSVEVKLANRTLTISGEKRAEKEEKKKDYYLAERRYGSFRRSFGLPEGVDTDKIDARFKDGILKIVLPKTPQAQQEAKKIAVKTG